MLALPLTMMLVLMNQPARAQTQPSALLNFAVAGAGWRVATFPQQAMPVTVYTDATESGRYSLRLEAESAFGPLIKTITPAATLKLGHHRK
jgi:hypothetical protein